MSDPTLVQRLKERKIFQWALAYLAGAFVVLQAMDPVSQAWGIAPLLLQGVQVLLVVGFFATLVLAWYHGEQGRQRVGGTELVLLALLLVLAGGVLTQLPGGDVGREAEGAEGTGEEEVSDIARLAAFDPDRPTIAVLPLSNLSTRDDNAYMAAGVHEELLRLLSLVRELGVVSRTSVLQYADGRTSIPDIARELGARYIVEGSVQEAQGHVRIQVQLIDATTDRHLWAQRYDRPLDDIFALQSEVAQAIAGELHAVVSPDERGRIRTLPTEDPVAYDLYLQAVGLNHFDPEESTAAITLLRRATALDPDFGLAHARLASLFRYAAVVGGASVYDSALARARLAVEVAPDLPAALATLGYLLGEVDQPDSARTVLHRALALDPSHAKAWDNLSFVGWASGDMVEGALAGRRAVQVDPNGEYVGVGYALWLVGMHAEAASWMARLVERNPGNMWGWQVLVATAYEGGDYDTARVFAQRMRETSDDSPMALYYAAQVELGAGEERTAEALIEKLCESYPRFGNYVGPSSDVFLAWLQARSGRWDGKQRLEGFRERALRGAEAGSRTAIMDLVLIASVLGSEDELVQWFQMLLAPDAVNAVYMFRHNPWWNPIRHRPEFQTWTHETEAAMAQDRRILATMGPWMAGEVMGRDR